MSRINTMLLALAVVAAPMLSVPSEATAGPLLDWIRGCRKPSCLTRNRNTVYRPQVAAAASNAYGLQPGQCMKTCQQTCARTVVNYVPVTAYRTDWQRVPVTQYKPVTNADPCTGCTVTCMRPCTTYTYQMQRVPYTTYRPEYRTENYTVPVTTITNDCATGNCGTGTSGTDPGCTSCGTGTPSFQTPVIPPTTNFGPSGPTYSQPPANYGPAVPSQPNNSLNGTYYEYPNSGPPTSMNRPSGTISTEGVYNTSVEPADLVPSLQGINPQGSVRPVLDQIRSSQPMQANYTTDNRRRATYPQPTPAVYTSPTVGQPTSADKTARSPVTKEFDYSPVRMASYTSTRSIETTRELRRLSTRSTEAHEPVRIESRFRGADRADEPTRVTRQSDLNGWIEVK